MVDRKYDKKNNDLKEMSYRMDVQRCGGYLLEHDKLLSFFFSR